MSLHESELDYAWTGDRRVEGTHETRMRSVHPYASWSWQPGSHVWAMPGYGEVEIGDDDAKAAGVGRKKADLRLKSAAIGGSLRLAENGEWIAGGATTLNLKGEGWLTRLELDGNGASIEPVMVDASRLRLALEAAHERRLGNGALLRPSVELGLRHGGGDGDGETGFGVELGGGADYIHHRLAIGLHGRALLAHEGDVEEWGVSGSLGLAPGRDGRRPLPRPALGLARISHTGQVHRGSVCEIVFFDKDIAQDRGVPRCKHSVARHRSVSKRSRGVRWWRRSMAGR